MGNPTRHFHSNAVRVCCRGSQNLHDKICMVKLLSACQILSGLEILYRYDECNVATKAVSCIAIVRLLIINQTTATSNTPPQVVELVKQCDVRVGHLTRELTSSVTKNLLQIPHICSWFVLQLPYRPRWLSGFDFGSGTIEPTYRTRIELISTRARYNRSLDFDDSNSCFCQLHNHPGISKYDLSQDPRDPVSITSDWDYQV